MRRGIIAGVITAVVVVSLCGGCRGQLGKDIEKGIKRFKGVN